MRGQNHRTGGRGRGRGGDGRNRSPPPSKMKGNRSRHHNNSPLPRRSSGRSLSPLPSRRGPRRNLSPLPDRNRSRCSPLPNRNRPHRSPLPLSASLELQRERDYSFRRLEHEKHQLTSFTDDGFDHQHKYMLPDHPTDLSDVAALLKSSRSIKDKDLAGSSSSGVGQMLVQKSMYLDDGSKRTFFSLPQDSGHTVGSGSLNCSDSVRTIGGSSFNVGMPRYHEQLRDPYADAEKEKVYPKDVSFPRISSPPAPQGRPFVGACPSRFSKDTDFVGLYGGRGDVGKISDEPLEYKGYNQTLLSDPVRRVPLISSAAREEHLDYGYDEFGRRGRDSHVHVPPNDPYGKMVHDPRDQVRNAVGPSFLDVAGGRVDRDNASRKNFGAGSSWDNRRSLLGDTTLNFADPKEVHEDYVSGAGSGYVGYGLKVSRDYELPTYEDNYRCGRDDIPRAYRERSSSPLLVDHPMFRHDVSPPREKLRLGNDNIYESPERLARRRYVVSDDVHERKSYRRMQSDNVDERNTYRRMQSPSPGDDMWPYEEQGPVEERRRFLLPKKHVIGRSRNRMLSHRLSRNGVWAQSSGSSAHMEGGRGISLKKRLRASSFTLERRQNSFRPHKVWKRGQEDMNGSVNAPDGDALIDSAQQLKNDPPEGSEEFKKQVHKAFLRFSKLLNESPRQQKMYRDEQRKFVNLLCCVCGSNSKEFVDVHSLLTHSYHSLKVGLRTEHLGFHKALCVLNDWNWLVVPDTGKSYKGGDPVEIKALREDLILWPPIVIVHNSSIVNKSKTNEPKVVTIEGLEEILREMGFGGGKTRVCGGKPANQSVMVVKFLPTFSGLQEADRLQKYYAENSRGRLGFQQITSNNGSSNAGESQAVKDEELLYGYMAVAEDLDKLGPETKKRCVVKSRKDIEAIADAPLNTD